MTMVCGRLAALAAVVVALGVAGCAVMLQDAGADCSTTDLTSCAPLASVRFTGGHDATALAVVGGRVDAGGLELRILHRLEREGVVAAGDLRVLEQREVMGYQWVARTELGSDVIENVRQAFLGIDDPDRLDLLGARSYTSVESEDYEEVRREARRAGLLG